MFEAQRGEPWQMTLLLFQTQKLGTARSNMLGGFWLAGVVRAYPLYKERRAKNAVSHGMLCPQGNLHVVGLEALTVATMENTVFCVATPCSPVEVHRRFGGMYHLHLQGRRVTQQKQERSLPPAYCWRCRLYVPPKRWRYSPGGRILRTLSTSCSVVLWLLLWARGLRLWHCSRNQWIGFILGNCSALCLQVQWFTFIFVSIFMNPENASARGRFSFYTSPPPPHPVLAFAFLEDSRPHGCSRWSDLVKIPQSREVTWK
jgi:hypothetical protein